ncbi:MAG TPA: hypothetical protein VGS20_02030 [Candidatus Acidoferrales bacterium]|nr:hypothetical protein [Candidatus Acidoferrales bacterium]
MTAGADCPALKYLAAALAALALAMAATAVRAQQSQVSVNQDCIAFAFSPDGQRIAYAVRRISRVKRELIEHDDIEEVSASGGHGRQLMDGAKMFEAGAKAAPFSYTIHSLRYSPDGRRLTVELYAQAFTLRTEPGHGKNAKPTQVVVPSGKGAEMTLLLDADGKEIKIAATGKSTLENAFDATWLASGATVAYLTEPKNGTLYGLASLDPSTGKATPLMPAHGYLAVAWDPARNAAVAIEPSDQPNRPPSLVRIDLLGQTEQALAPIDDYASHLTLSPDGAKVAYFADGQTLVIRDAANPARSARITVPMGRFEWAPDDAHLLLKRGPDEQTDQLLWVGVADGQFGQVLHGLIYHDFHVSPNGRSVAVTEPGSHALRVFPLP